MLFWVQQTTQNKFIYAYEDLSLIGFERFECCACGRVIAQPQFQSDTPYFLLDKGREAPDLLWFSGAGRQPFLISERALNLCEKYHISGYSGHHLVAVEYTGETKVDVKLPNYYSLDITGKVDLDFAKMCLKKKRKCASCGKFDWNRQRLSPMFLDETTWDGSDLCFVQSFPGFKVCSERMKDLAEIHKLTGFSFEVAL